MLLGSLEAGELLPAAVIILRSVLCAAYLLPIIRIAFSSLHLVKTGKTLVFSKSELDRVVYQRCCAGCRPQVNSLNWPREPQWIC